jgi:glycosyltransferase involved in cell wall biosynthesis
VRYPKISVVTPSFNQGEYVEQTIRSVILQRYPNVEYVMMDGGSTDETTAILDRYGPHFAHVQSAPDAGQADAIKRGFERTSGEIMAYLNSDDLFAPDAFFAVAEFFDRNPGVDVVYSNRCAILSDNSVAWYWRLPPHNDFLMKRWDLIPQETTFWRRGIYERVGGVDASFRFAMDYDLFAKFMNAFAAAIAFTEPSANTRSRRRAGSWKPLVRKRSRAFGASEAYARPASIDWWGTRSSGR